MSSEETSPGDKARKALTEIAIRQRPRPSPEFAAYLRSLDAVQFHVGLYLLTEVKISSSAVVDLWPLSEPQRFEDAEQRDRRACKAARERFWSPLALFVLGAFLFFQTRSLALMFRRLCSVLCSVVLVCLHAFPHSSRTLRRSTSQGYNSYFAINYDIPCRI
jgi:hypothetical protein